MTPLILAAALAATFTAVDKAGENAGAILKAGQDASERLIPTFDRDSDAVRALNAAPEKTLAA